MYHVYFFQTENVLIAEINITNSESWLKWLLKQELFSVNNNFI